jgi:hypothetical protein
MPFIIGGTMMIPVGVNDANDGEIPGVSVYGSKAEQDAVYEVVQNSKLWLFLEKYGLTLLKESIMPVYSASLLEYAETGVFTIKPDIVRGSGIVYIAKTVIADGSFAGDLWFYILDGVAYRNGFEPTPVLEQFFDSEYGFGGNEFLVSHSYADHAKRIKNAANRESFVPVGEVRYVGVDGLGQVFYINDGKTEALVNMEAADDIFAKRNREIVYIGEELKKIAEGRLSEHKAILAEQKAWEAANPGKIWDVVGDGGMVSMSLVRENVDDIANIADYLSLENDLAYTTGTMPEATARAITGSTANASTETPMEATDTTTGAPASTPAGTANSLARASLIALPLAVLALLVGIMLVRKDKRTETTNSQSNDN